MYSWSIFHTIKTTTYNQISSSHLLCPKNEKNPKVMYSISPSTTSHLHIFSFSNNKTSSKIWSSIEDFKTLREKSMNQTRNLLPQKTLGAIWRNTKHSGQQLIPGTTQIVNQLWMWKNQIKPIQPKPITHQASVATRQTPMHRLRHRLKSLL